MDREKKNTGGHLSPERIKKYLQNELSNAEMHEVELHLLDCDFCSDAVEGFELSTLNSINTEHTLHDLRHRLADRVKTHESHRKLARWPAWSAAAGIALAIAGYVVIKYMELEEQKSPKTMVERIIAQLKVDNNDTLLIYIPRTDELMAYNDSKIPSVSTNQVAPIEKPSIFARVAAKEQSEGINKAEQKTEDHKEAVASQKPVVITAYAAQQKRALTGSVTTIMPLDSSEQSLKMTKNNPKTVLRGKVVSKDDGQPLPGVNLSIAATGDGTTTDMNGNFKLVTSADSSKVTVSYIGFQPETFLLNDTSQLAKIVLEPDQQALDQVVVVGYGSPVSQKAAPRVNTDEYERYLKSNLIYPQKALEHKVEGDVVVRFTVTKDAILRHFNIVKPLGYGCDEEAIRLIKEGPKWNPTVKNGQAKSERVKQTVTFSLPHTQ